MYKKTSLLVFFLLVSFSASASDAIQASVAPIGQPAPIVTYNGNPYSPGTYAVGTIQLFYTLTAFHFTAGPFATFSVNMVDAAGPGTAPTYPVNLNLVQTGSHNLTLTPVLSTYSVTGVGWTNSSTVSISIPSAVVSDPSLNVDGTDLVGNLQFRTSPAGSHLDTVTTVQVHIKLAYPINCLRMFNFITDEAFTTAINSIGVNVAHGKVRATNPFGQLSDNILVVNTCSTGQSFDLKISLDSSFDTQPHGNPGNAVFTYFMTGFVDPSTFNISAFTSGTAQGERLCLANITVPAGQTFLTTVHMGIVKGLLPSQLPSDWSFDYSAEARAAGSGCLGALNSLVTPNPAPASLSFSLN